MEHVFSASAIIQNTLQHGLPFAMTFLNLENAFGSISHELILDVQTAARGHFLHHKFILKADCVCEDKEVVHRQVQN